MSDFARLACIARDDLDYLIDTSKPRGIAWEKATIGRLFAMRHKQPWHCGTARDDISCHIRICRGLERDLSELSAERSRREGVAA